MTRRSPASVSAWTTLCSNARDTLSEGLYVRAKGREAKGLATMALASTSKEGQDCGWIRNAIGPVQTKVQDPEL